jgi:hypothetical protein
MKYKILAIVLLIGISAACTKSVFDQPDEVGVQQTVSLADQIEPANKITATEKGVGVTETPTPTLTPTAEAPQKGPGFILSMNNQASPPLIDRSISSENLMKELYVFMGAGPGGGGEEDNLDECEYIQFCRLESIPAFPDIVLQWGTLCLMGFEDNTNFITELYAPDSNLIATSKFHMQDTQLVQFDLDTGEDQYESDVYSMVNAWHGDYGINFYQAGDCHMDADIPDSQVSKIENANLTRMDFYLPPAWLVGEGDWQIRVHADDQVYDEIHSHEIRHLPDGFVTDTLSIDPWNYARKNSYQPGDQVIYMGYGFEPNTNIQIGTYLDETVDSSDIKGDLFFGTGINTNEAGGFWFAYPILDSDPNGTYSFGVDSVPDQPFGSFRITGSSASSSPKNNPQADAECPKAPSSRVDVGERFRVCTGADRLKLRENPGSQGSILDNLEHGTMVKVISGPVCENDLLWWQVEPDYGWTAGWVAEGSIEDADPYFLCPQ